MTILSLFDLTNQVALITGGGGLLGVSHAEAIAQMGGFPILIDINQDHLERAQKSLGKLNHAIYRCDITQKASLEELLVWIKQKYGKLDILINNAAINPKVESSHGLESSRLESYSLHTFQKELDVGLTASFLCAQIFGSYMAEQNQGVILNIASDLGLIAPNQTLYTKEGLLENQQPVKPVSYSVIKHGLIGLTRYLATYWAHKGIRCNALAPGGIENGQDPVFLSRIQKIIPLGRMAHINEYQASVIFLVSQASSYMTGAILSVDGGRTCW